MDKNALSVLGKLYLDARQLADIVDAQKGQLEEKDAEILNLKNKLKTLSDTGSDNNA